MNWYILDYLGRKWYPYVMENEVLLHPEDSDTDMGDMFVHEVVHHFGPLEVALNG